MAGEVVVQTMHFVANLLHEGKVPWAVIGGVALSAWDRVRNTFDVDFLVEVDHLMIDDVLDSLQTSGLRPKRTPLLFSIGSQRLAQFYYAPPETFIDIQVDLLFAESLYQHDVLSRRKKIRMPGSDEAVYIISCEDLIVFKLIAGRMIDLADAESLLHANRAILDFGLLRRECERNELLIELQQVWDRAFPGEAMPQGVGA